MNKGYHVAIIGCGAISKNHLKALENVKNAACIAVYDVIRERADEVAGEYGIQKVYYDYKDVLEDMEIDVVHICTPHYLHAQMAVDAFEAGKNVLCEKPMALTREDARRMIEARNRSGLQLAVCFQNRYNEASVYIKKVMDSGILGRITGGRAQVTWDRKPEYYSTSDWRGTWEKEGGGVLINQAIHTFDLIQWLTFRIKTVEASLSTKRLKGVIEVEDTVDIMLTGEQGQRILFYASNCYVKNAPVELEIICEHGSIKMVGNEVTTNQDGTITSRDYSSGTVCGKDYWGSGHGFLIDDFYRCLEEGVQFPVSGEEAFVSVELLEAVYRSGKEQLVVNIQ